MRARHRRSSALGAEDLAIELTRIADLDTDALRSHWLRMTGKSASRQLSGDLLRRMVMHRIQERCLGGLDRKLAAHLDRLIDGGASMPARLRLGSVLVREHDGIVHQVMVVEGGFAWQDRVMPSLSAVAQAITGTKWNGRHFFGLRKTKVVEADPGSIDAIQSKTIVPGSYDAPSACRGTIHASARAKAGSINCAEGSPW